MVDTPVDDGAPLPRARGQTPAGRLRAPALPAAGRLSRFGPSGLLARVRWLFLLFALLAVSTTFLAIAQSDAVRGTDRAIAVVAVACWAGWLLYRYSHPAAGIATDLVAPAALVVVGWALHDPALVNGAAYVSLFLRALYGGRREAAGNAVLYFLTVHITTLSAPGADAYSGLQAVVNLVSFVAVALVMQGLGEAVGRHETAAHRERVLTAVSARLLQARTPAQVHQVAVDGTLELAGLSEASASVWIGGDVLELAATAGPDLIDLRRAPVSAVPPAFLERFLEGRPYVLDGEDTRQVERAYGQPHRFREVMVGPLVQADGIVGALVLASPQPLDVHVLDFMERFANEISLAAERAALIGDLETANTELRYADEMKDQFLSTVSHELRTPLTSIHGFAQTLRRQNEMLSTEQRDRFLEIIERQSLRQQRLVEDLLTTSRMAAGRLSADAVDVDVLPLFGPVLEELRIAPADIDLRCPADARAHVDPMHLHQIVVNLLTNAQKYGAPPYVIDVTTSPGSCTIAIHDHGPGIPEGFRDKLFQPFAQADSGDRRTSTGTGLGLAIIRNLVAANDGTITHHPDRPGAYFELTLPSGGSQPEPPPPSRTAPAGPDDARVAEGSGRS